MEKNKNFFKTILKALNPSVYDELSERRTFDAFKYFFSFIFIAFILLVLINIPFIISSPDYFHQQLEKFDTLEISINVSMNEPLYIPLLLTDVMIDTRTEEYNFSKKPEENHLITKNYYYAKIPFSAFSRKPYSEQYERFRIGDFKNVLENRQWYSNILTGLIILIIPSLFVIGYIFIAIKYLLLILLAALIGLLVTRLLKFNITFARLIKVGLYAITLPVLLELIGIMFNFSQYYIHYLLFVAAFILGTVRAGDLQDFRPRKPKPKVGGRKRKASYIEIKARE